MPFDGTPLAGTWHLTPMACLRILALVRLACPATELRMAGGREMHLRSLQSTALAVANSLFLGDYLTSEGQDARRDLEMISDAGYVVLGQEDIDPAELAARLRHRADAAPAAVEAPGCGSGCGSCVWQRHPGLRPGRRSRRTGAAPPRCRHTAKPQRMSAPAPAHPRDRTARHGTPGCSGTPTPPWMPGRTTRSPAPMACG